MRGLTSGMAARERPCWEMEEGYLASLVAAARWLLCQGCGRYGLRDDGRPVTGGRGHVVDVPV